MFGAEWYNDDGTSGDRHRIRTGAAMFEWQKDFIVDVYGDGDFQTGADKLGVRGRSGDECSSANDFQNGRIAMKLDGEWRTAFIADEVARPQRTTTAPLPGAGRPGRQVRDRAASAGPSSGSRRARRTRTRRGCSSRIHGDRHRHPRVHGEQRRGTCRRRSTSLELAGPGRCTPQFQTFLDIFQNPDSTTTRSTSAIGVGRPEPPGGVRRRLAGRRGRPTWRQGWKTRRSRSTTNWRRRRSSGRTRRRARPT